MGHRVIAVRGLWVQIALNSIGPDERNPGAFPTIQLGTGGDGNGVWRRTNVLTVPYMYSEVPLSNLVVCWSDGEVDATTGEVLYKKEVGRLNVLPPPLLREIYVTIITNLRAAAAPFILSFITGDIPYYAQAENGIRLRISVPDYKHVDLYESSGGLKMSRDLFANEIHERSQGICGKVIKEAWSNDTTFNDFANPYSKVFEKQETSGGPFPVPNGCYYDILHNQLEFFMVFEGENGLKAQTEYQIILNGQFFSNEAKIQVTVFGDVLKDMYKVVEMGE